MSDQNVSCYACGNVIEKYYTEALGHPYHPEHWTCKSCNVILGSDEFYSAGDGVRGLCKPCYMNTPEMKCARCNKPIADQYVPEGSVKYHPECHEAMSERCTICANPITGSSKKAKDRFYHPACFTCASCRRELDNEYVEKDNNAYCVSCGSKFMQQQQQQSSSSSSSRSSQPPITCSTCGKGVDRSRDTSITLGTKTYHELCSCCCVCDTQLAKDRSGNTIKCRQRKDGAIICESCHSTSHSNAVPTRVPSEDSEVSNIPCRRCGKNITDRHISLEGSSEKFHVECFKCDDCYAQLTTNFYGIKGRRLCDHCVAKCTACQNTLTGEYADALGGKYHTSCFKCSKCNSLLEREFYNLNGSPACENCSKKN